MKRKTITILLSLVFCFSFAAAAAAGIGVQVNGNALTFDQPPIIDDGRTLVPLRVIFEALGASVEWEPSTQTITAVKDNTTVTLRIDSNILVKNGANIQLDVPAKIVGGRTLVPARAVAESFGADVGWDQSTQIVEISTSGTLSSGLNSASSTPDSAKSYIRKITFYEKHPSVPDFGAMFGLEPYYHKEPSERSSSYIFIVQDFPSDIKEVYIDRLYSEGFKYDAKDNFYSNSKTLISVDYDTEIPAITLNIVNIPNY